MCRGPTAVSTEFGPMIGLSGDSPVSDGASSGLAVKSDLTWSGWLVITGEPATMPRIRNTSPSSRRARNTNSIWRWLKRSTWIRRGSGISGGDGRLAASSGSSGPAGDRGASPKGAPGWRSSINACAASIAVRNDYTDRCYMTSGEHRQRQRGADDVLPGVHDLADLQVHAEAGQHVCVLAWQRPGLCEVIDHRPDGVLRG